jgi:hypothetical protein
MQLDFGAFFTWSLEVFNNDTGPTTVCIGGTAP